MSRKAEVLSEDELEGVSGGLAVPIAAVHALPESAPAPAAGGGKGDIVTLLAEVPADSVQSQ